MNNNTLEFDQFIRSIQISKKETFSFLLGAGASITSGIPSAAECIWEWKQAIHSSQTGKRFTGLESKSDQIKPIIQKWLDNEGIYPPLNGPEEYSFYVERCYPIEEDRSKFFRSISERKEPSVGYKLLVFLHQIGMVQSVWTTNFDELCSHSAIKMGSPIIEITLDTVDRIFRPQNASELLLIKLHGDYRFGPLKNTSTELRDQDGTFRSRLVNYLSDKHLIVSGYSGRDESVMSALTEAYSQKGAGRLYWCGYGHDIPSNVQKLIEFARSNGRTACYVPTDGYDKTLISLAIACCSDDDNANAKLASYLKTNEEDNPNVPFSMNVSHMNVVLKSNLFPITFPKEVFQFDFTFNQDEKPWQTLREITKDKNIVAVPFKKSIWALGTLTDINNVFGNRIDGKISRVPISEIKPRKDTALHNLLLSALTQALANRKGLPHNGKDTIWLNNVDLQRRIDNVIYFIHKAIRLSFSFDGKKHFLSFIPEFHVSTEVGNETISKEVKQEIGRLYFEKLWNKQFNDYINDWRVKLLEITNPTFDFEFPINSGTGFNFSIWRNPVFASVMVAGSQKVEQLDETFPKALLHFAGIQFPEPTLLFSPQHSGMAQLPRDFHPLRGISKNRPYDHPMVGGIFETTIRLGVICPRQRNSQFSVFLKRIQSKISANNINPNYLIDYPGFYDTYGVSIDVPEIDTENWKECDEPIIGKSLKETTLDLRNKIIHQIDLLINDGIKKVLIICIPDSWLDFCSYDEENEQFDLHDYIKAYCAEKSIGTQFIQESTLRDSLICQINWCLSLSYFVKSLRTPWAIDSLDKDTAFAGIGYSVNRKNDTSEIVLGCSHIYNSSGQGLKYRLAKVEDQLIWDRMDRPHLSYRDAYKFGISIVDLFYTTMNELPKRIVIHKRNYYMEDEIKGLKDSLLGNGIKDIDLIEINFEDDMRFVAGKITQDGKPDIQGFPVGRGTCILLNSFEALLWTHGVVQAVNNSYYKYYLGGRFIPGPLKIIKHHGKSNIGTIANEILGLTKVNWNSFDLYSQLPATVSSSNEIARIGKLLSRRQGANYDYRFFI